MHVQCAALEHHGTRELLSRAWAPGITIFSLHFPLLSFSPSPSLCRRPFLRMWLWAQSF